MTVTNASLLSGALTIGNGSSNNIVNVNAGDTVVLVGSVATQFGAHKAAFALGAMTASVIFFFSLGYGARLLRPVFARPGAWQVLEVGIGIVMCTIAATLVA